MLWSLVSSAYVIYLYRKLKGTAAPSPMAPMGQPADIDAAVDTLERRLSALEATLAGRKKDPVR